MDEINKTIVMTLDDASRMVTFCKDADGYVSREFYDWYLQGENFFAKTGMLVIDDILPKPDRVCVVFDLTDPDKAEFTEFSYETQKMLTHFFFYRQNNLDINDVSVDIKKFEIQRITNMDLERFTNPIFRDKVLEITARLSAIETFRGNARVSREELLAKAKLKNAMKDVIYSNCQQYVYFTYALMYYVSKQEPEEITTLFNAEINKTGEKIKGIYKYTGYIDLRKNKTYKPLIPKDPEDPKREYQRHIQSWTVRGHYRHIGGKRVWIEPHIKGQGNVEKRIYGTEDEKDLNLMPQVFEVERTKVNKNIRKEDKQTGKIEHYVNRFVDFFKNFWRKIA